MEYHIEQFYQKENNPEYFLKYEREHGPRLDWTVKRFKLPEIESKKIADFGCGYGFLFKRLSPTNSFYGFDGAHIDKPFVPMTYDKVDLNTPFSKEEKVFDCSFCFETLEHLENPYRCLFEIKKLTKNDGDIYISIPHVNMTHNTIYPTLMYPGENFAVFLNQMALPIIDYDLFQDGWPSFVFRCKNRPWTESRMVFPKDEKFYGKTPVEYTNI